MAIYALKKGDFYITAAVEKLKVVNGFPERDPQAKTKFDTTRDINQARLIEDPNMDAVAYYGLVAVEVSADKPKIKETGVVLDHQM